jgi:hypothetical protein
MSLTIYGASDDLVEVEGHFREEYSAIDVPCTLRLVGDEGEIAVTMEYGDNGCWHATVAMPDEGAPLPWPVSITAAEECAYSVSVTVDCGEDVKVEEVSA